MGVLAAGDSRQVGRRAWCRRFVFGPGHPPFAGPASNRVALATRAGTPTASWRGPGTPTVRAVRETWGAGRDTHRPRTASRDSHRSSRLIKWVSPLEWLAPSGGCPHSTRRPDRWVSPLEFPNCGCPRSTRPPLELWVSPLELYSRTRWVSPLELYSAGPKPRAATASTGRLPGGACGAERCRRRCVRPCARRICARPAPTRDRGDGFR